MFDRLPIRAILPRPDHDIIAKGYFERMAIELANESRMFHLFLSPGSLDELSSL